MSIDMQEWEQMAERRIEEKLWRMRERYQGFYQHLEEKERAERIRQKEAQASKAWRAEQARQAERVRQEYVRTRKPKPDTEQAQLAYQRMVEERERYYEKLRQLYIKKRERLKQRAKNLPQIPPNKELDL